MVTIFQENDMGGAYSTLRTHTDALFENLKEGDRLEDNIKIVLHQRE
jgi:hypothetical protein